MDRQGIEMKARLLYACTDTTGEGALWMPESQTLLWVDIENGILHAYDERTGQVTDQAFPDMVTSLIPVEGDADSVVVALKNRLVRYSLTDRTFRTVTELSGLTPGLRTNDCKAGPDGRIWAGIMSLTDHNATGSLWRMGRGEAPVCIRGKQHIPNGIVWNARHDRMYYADSGRHCIEEYAYDGATGDICLLRTLVQVPSSLGLPDGMTIDADDRLWVAHWGGGCVCIWDTNTGEMTGRIAVDVPNVASCTFGGADGRRLFITTARAGLSEREMAAAPTSGSLFVVDLPADVRPAAPFACRLETEP